MDFRIGLGHADVLHDPVAIVIADIGPQGPADERISDQSIDGVARFAAGDLHPDHLVDVIGEVSIAPEEMNAHLVFRRTIVLAEFLQKVAVDIRRRIREIGYDLRGTCRCRASQSSWALRSREERVSARIVDPDAEFLRDDQEERNERDESRRKNTENPAVARADVLRGTGGEHAQDQDRQQRRPAVPGDIGGLRMAARSDVLKPFVGGAYDAAEESRRGPGRRECEMERPGAARQPHEKAVFEKMDFLHGDLHLSEEPPVYRDQDEQQYDAADADANTLDITGGIRFAPRGLQDLTHKGHDECERGRGGGGMTYPLVTIIRSEERVDRSRRRVDDVPAERDGDENDAGPDCHGPESPEWCTRPLCFRFHAFRN